jgi:hypothetical protein
MQIVTNETKKLHLSYRNEDKFINTDYLLLFHLFGFNISLEAIDIILASDDWAMSQLNYYDGIEYGLKKYLTTICSYYSDYSLAKFNFSADILEKFACKSKFFNHTTVDGNATFFNPFGPKFDRTENWFLEIDYAVKYDKNFVISHHFNITELKNS